jgi:hypothetical protein
MSAREQNRRLSARPPPAQAARHCPFRTTTLARRHGAVKLTPLFHKRRLRPGTVVEVRITAPGRIGRVSRVTIRSTKGPRLAILCLQPGATRATRCS